MIESFWSKMQVELLNRQKWNTRVELANAIFDYLEIFHNRRRRHSALGMLTPERLRSPPQDHPSRMNPRNPSPRNRGHAKVSGLPGAIQLPAWPNPGVGGTTRHGLQ